MRARLSWLSPLCFALAFAACGEDAKSVSDPCKLAENADHPACSSNDLCTLPSFKEHPACVTGDLCEHAAFADKAACQTKEICAHADYADHAVCIEEYCETEAPSRYRETKCASPDRLMEADIAELPTRTNLCENDPQFEELVERTRPEDVGLESLQIGLNCGMLSGGTNIRLGCAANMYKMITQLSTGCATCFGEAAVCALASCNDACSMEGLVADGNNGQACAACISTNASSCAEALTICTVGSDQCEGVDCNGHFCNSFNGACETSCWGPEDCVTGFTCENYECTPVTL